jgi:NosR/NirI family transcriptional regulator, nitrous oxide reductase regulator
MFKTYARWLHTQWPAGTVEPRPEVGPGGATNLPGVRVVGELAGRVLLRDAAASGAEAVRAIVAERGFAPSADPSVPAVAVIGAGVAGTAAAIDARRAGLSVSVYEAAAPFSGVRAIPRAHRIVLPAPGAGAARGLPPEPPAGGLSCDGESRDELLENLSCDGESRDELLENLELQRIEAGLVPETSRIDRIETARDAITLHHAGGRKTRARRVIVAIGRDGVFPRLGCPGDDLDKVRTRILDPTELAGKHALVAGDGDCALETAIALATCGAKVTLACAGAEFARPAAENVARLQAIAEQPEAQVHVEHPSSERVTTATMRNMKSPEGPGSLKIRMATRVAGIDATRVTLVAPGQPDDVIPNDAVFSMIGRAEPAAFLRQSGLRLRGAWDAAAWMGLGLSFLLCALLFHWTGNRPEFPFQQFVASNRMFPYDVPGAIDALGGTIAELSENEPHLLYTLKKSLGTPSFYYAIAFTSLVVVFGVRRIRRRRTPYVLWQTLSLMLVQCVFLFLLPEIILPWAGRNGHFERGHSMRWIADCLFERSDGYLGHERAYWRAYGFILPFPLNLYNVFTDRPMWTWLAISAFQTLVVIPLIVRKWGKGGFCGWICSAGALAETMGDAQREKMPHGPQWNRLNMAGQAMLGVVLVMLGWRFLAWTLGPRSWAETGFKLAFQGLPFLNYTWLVDVVLAGIIGIGSYFWLSGRVWCRFACPLGALMNVHARSSLFRILPDKAKCISCNVCTSVCHMGVDVMNFANKDQPVRDPQCVRCSACVEQCPTAALGFGYVRKSGEVVFDKLRAIRAERPGV